MMIPILMMSIWSHRMFFAGTPACDLNSQLGKDSASWALTSTGAIKSNGQVVGKVDKKIQEGDILVG